MISSRRYAVAAAILLTCVFADGCNPRSRVEAARRLAEEYHQRYKGQQFDLMYKEAGPDIQKSTTRTGFIKYQTNVRDKLGDLKTADVVNYNILYLLGGPQVRLDYRCTFAKGLADESFEIDWKNDRPVVNAYRLDSPLLNAK